MILYLANRDLYQLSTASARQVLISYYYVSESSLIKLVNKHFEVVSKIFIDSGGFSAFTQNEEIDIEAYCDWIKESDHLITAYANLDVIGNQVRTRINQEKMESEGLSPIPVFHVGSGMKELKRLCAKYPYIAIGGMVPYMKKPKEIYPFLCRVFEIASDNKLHGFGCTNLEVLFNFPWYSVDSSTWIVGAKFGEVPIFDEREETIIRISFGDWSKWRQYSRKIERMGFDWKKIASSKEQDKNVLFNLSRATFEEVEAFLNRRWESNARDASSVY